MTNFSIQLIMVLLSFLTTSVSVAEDITFSTANFKPYHYQEDGEIKGLYIEVVRTISQRLGLSATFSMYPLKRALAATKNAKTDGIVSVYYSDDRAAFLYYVKEPLGKDNISLISGVKNDLEITKPSDLRGQYLLQVRGTSYAPAFDDFRDNFEGIWYCDNTTKQIRLLEKKPTSFAIANETAFLSATQQMSLQEKFKVVYVVREMPVHVAFSKKLGEKGKNYAENFGSALKEIKNEGKATGIDP